MNIELVVSRCWLRWDMKCSPRTSLRNVSTTQQEIIAHMEELYGRAGRVWVMDRGLASEKNIHHSFLRAGGRRYILGTAKNT